MRAVSSFFCGRLSLFFSALMALLFVAISLGLQTFRTDMDPCSLCVIQRYAYIVYALSAFLFTVSLPRRSLFQGFSFSQSRNHIFRNMIVARTFLILSLIVVTFGLGLASYHLYLLKSASFSCSLDTSIEALNALPTAKWLPQLFEVKALCSDAIAPIFGTSIVEWSFAAMLLLFLWVVFYCKVSKLGQKREF